MLNVNLAVKEAVTERQLFSEAMIEILVGVQRYANNFQRFLTLCKI